MEKDIDKSPDNSQALVSTFCIGCNVIIDIDIDIDFCSECGNELTLYHSDLRKLDDDGVMFIKKWENEEYDREFLDLLEKVKDSLHPQDVFNARFCHSLTP